MHRIALTLLATAVILSAAGAQEPATSIARVNGVDGKPWPIKLARRGGPEIETFDAPYVLTPGTQRPALWFLEGDQCVPVPYAAVGKRFGNFEVVRSGAEFFFTYVVDGVNEFWRLDGDKAAQVTLEGKPFSQRARVTRGGGAPFLFQGDVGGKTNLFEIREGAAEPIKLADSADHGTISYTWHVGDRLLAAFYLAGTYDFHLLTDGKFVPAWEHNGVKEYDSQVDSISEIWAGERLFFSVVRRDGSADMWAFDGERLKSVQVESSKLAPDWSKQAFAANEHGVYFIMDGGLFLADGAKARPVKLGGKTEDLACKGGSVLARGKEAAWFVTGTEVTTLNLADSELVAHVGGADVLRTNGAMKLYRAGRPAGEMRDLPENFGLVERSWAHKSAAYIVENASAEAPAYRLWVVR
jgi:hypothetical protein